MALSLWGAGSNYAPIQLCWIIGESLPYPLVKLKTNVLRQLP